MSSESRWHFDEPSHLRGCPATVTLVVWQRRTAAAAAAAKRETAAAAKAAKAAALRETCGAPGSKMCEHGRRRNQCKDCGGSGICEHGRLP